MRYLSFLTWWMVKAIHDMPNIWIDAFVNNYLFEAWRGMKKPTRRISANLTPMPPVSPFDARGREFISSFDSMRALYVVSDLKNNMSVSFCRESCESEQEALELGIEVLLENRK